MTMDQRHPQTLEELIADCLDANANPTDIYVIPGHALFVDIASRIISLEHGAETGNTG